MVLSKEIKVGDIVLFRSSLFDDPCLSIVINKLEGSRKFSMTEFHLFLSSCETVYCVELNLEKIP
jgi:hypothetical protein